MMGVEVTPSLARGATLAGRASLDKDNPSKHNTDADTHHLHRRYFIGPQPEKVVSDAILLAGASTTTSPASSSSKRALRQSTAIKAFFSSSSSSHLESSINLNDASEPSAMRQKLVAVDGAWKQTKWGSYLTSRREKRKGVEAGRENEVGWYNENHNWVGESFRIGTIGDPSAEQGGIDVIEETEGELRDKSRLRRQLLTAASRPSIHGHRLEIVQEEVPDSLPRPVLSATATAPRNTLPLPADTHNLAISTTLIGVSERLSGDSASRPPPVTPTSMTGLLEEEGDSQPSNSRPGHRNRVHSVPSRPSPLTKLPSLTKSDAHINILHSAKGKGKSKAAPLHEVGVAPSDNTTPPLEIPVPPTEVVGRAGSSVHGTSAGATVPTGETLPDINDSEGDGVILRDRMLVRVTYSKKEDLPACFDEQQMRSCSDLRYENWAEFMVVWRGRRIEFYEDYSFRAQEWVKGHKRLSYSISLKSKDGKTNTANLCLFSFVDMTICLTCRPNAEDSSRANGWLFFNRDKGGTNIFVMKVKSRTRAVDWTWQLWRYLGGRIPKTLEVVSPLVDTKVTVQLPDLDRLENERLLLNSKTLGRAQITALCMGAISEHEEWKWILDHQLKLGKELELAWRMDTTLDWIWLEHDILGNWRPWSVLCGAAFSQSTMSPQLEIRLANHSPTSLLVTGSAAVRLQPPNVSPLPSSSGPSRDSSLSTETSRRLHEPDSIEGYLTRIRPNTQFKQQLYLATHDGCLFSIDSAHAHPPDPPVPPRPDEDLSTFAWRLRRSEVARTAHQLSHAHAVCDLRQIVAVRRAFHHAIEHRHDVQEPSQGTGQTLAEAPAWVAHWTREETFSEQDEHDQGGPAGLESLGGEPVQVLTRRSFELLFKSGTLVRFETYSCRTAIEWINRLRALIFYWKQRHIVDAKEEMELATTRRARVTPRMHAFQDDELLPPEAPPDLSMPMPALGTLYNWCVLEGCKPIMRGGSVYSRHGLRGQFKYVQLFLIRGELLRFKISHDEHFYGATKKRIGLVDAYVGSGYFAAASLPADQYHPNGPVTPRRYQDGLEADDPDEDLLFIVWYRSSKAPKPSEAIASSCSFDEAVHASDDDASTASEGEDPQNEGVSSEGIKIPSLSAKWRMAVFKTRSKLERDSWCWAINCEIERLARSQKGRETQLRETGSLVPVPHS